MADWRPALTPALFYRAPRAALKWLAEAFDFEVFMLIAQGVGPSEIGKRLDMSVKTVETHRGHIKQKLGLKSGTELDRFSMQWAMKNL